MTAWLHYITWQMVYGLHPLNVTSVQLSCQSKLRLTFTLMNLTDGQQSHQSLQHLKAAVGLKIQCAGEKKTAALFSLLPLVWHVRFSWVVFFLSSTLRRFSRVFLSLFNFLNPVVSSPVSRMAPRAVWLLVALSGVLHVRSCWAYTCPAICRCSADTFQCSRDTQLASRARATPVPRL